MNDTHPEAARVQIGIIRRMSPARRGQLASALRNRTYWMARRAIEKAHPELSLQEQKLLFIKIHYGADLAERVRAQWQGKAQDHA